jgi:hypothetical protein
MGSGHPRLIPEDVNEAPRMLVLADRGKLVANDIR